MFSPCRLPYLSVKWINFSNGPFFQFKGLRPPAAGPPSRLVDSWASREVGLWLAASGLMCFWRPLGKLPRYLWEAFGLSWDLLGSSSGSPGPSWGPPGPLLGAIEAFLAILGAVLGPSWRFLGCSWGLFGPPAGIWEACLDIFLNRSARRPDFQKIVLPCRRDHDF